MDHLSLGFSPLVPWWLITAFAAVAAIVTLLMLLGRQKGGMLRGLALALILLALANPSIINEDRDRLNDVVALLVDKTGSQTLENRAADTERAQAAIAKALAARPNTDVKFIEVTEKENEADGTKLFDALSAGLSDVPADRLAGIITITDGQVHDVPPSLKSLGITAPFHVLLTGRTDEADRRIEVLEAPRFGLVGKDQIISFQVVQAGRMDGPANVVIKRDGKVIQEIAARPAVVNRINLRIEHAGANLFEVTVTAAKGELTTLNNTALISIEGIRDKLKVLLVSGEPHAGERTWRNLLKADANVDLVHFTILRPPEKQNQDGATIKELSLIQFPTRELFQQKIGEFDLIIFDRYSNQTILPSSYFDNIARYVRNGGALLIAAGPEFGAPGGLQTTNLRTVIPVNTTGRIIERPYLARVTPVGARHPVTRSLPGAEGEQPSWAPWFRLIGATTRAGATVMSGADDGPLLVLSREEKGRVALFLSDQSWLWARGFGEGGPYLDLLRRLSHWLMKEPELEEEALQLSAKGRLITIERHTLADKAADVTMTGPDGQATQVTLAQAEPGLWRAEYKALKGGLYQASDGALTALINVGPPNPREFRDVLSTPDLLEPIATETGGSVRRLNQPGGFTVPRLVDIRSGSRFGGSDYIGLKPNEAYIVKGLGLFPLTAGLAGLALLLIGTIAAWLREGRGFRMRQS
ncbi:MAG: hypothetical protein K2P80_13540 [Beijerinckiaceae bacterium]|nr:hypothetical protein [Beijerinckiaceae bacterium]